MRKLNEHTNPAAAPNGECFGWPFSGTGGRRYCGAKAKATIRMLDEQDHPDWRACRQHAKDIETKDADNPDIAVEWD